MATTLRDLYFMCYRKKMIIYMADTSNDFGYMSFRLDGNPNSLWKGGVLDRPADIVDGGLSYQDVNGEWVKTPYKLNIDAALGRDNTKDDSQDMFTEFGKMFGDIFKPEKEK